MATEMQPAMADDKQVNTNLTLKGTQIATYVPLNPAENAYLLFLEQSTFHISN